MSTILDLDSGYKVSIPLSGPFRFDDIMQRYPLPEPVTRPITLASGDVIETPYNPPEVWPDKDDVAEYELYARHQAYLLAIQRARERRNREQAHSFLISIDVIDGPHSPFINKAVNLVKWVLRAFGKPLDKMILRKRYLSFLKLYVIASNDDWREIQGASIAREVNLDGILQAAKEQFRGVLGQ